MNVDRLTGWPCVAPLGHSTTSNAVITALRRWFPDIGVPVVLMTDGGPQFSSRLFAVFCQRWGIDHISSSPHYPQTNGHAEADTAIPLAIKLYVALRVGVAVILSQRLTPGTIEYSTNGFCGGTYVLAGVLNSQDFKLCFGAKKLCSGLKIGKVTKRRSVKPTCANGGTN